MPRRKRISSPFDLSDDDCNGELLNYQKDNRNEIPPVQRNAANARERARMRVLSSAFGKLKTKLPNIPPDTKLSKLDTLRLATMYIKQLQAVVQCNSHNPYNDELNANHIHLIPENMSQQHQESQSMNWPFDLPTQHIRPHQPESYHINNSPSRSAAGSTTSFTSTSQNNSNFHYPAIEVKQQLFKLKNVTQGSYPKNSICLGKEELPSSTHPRMNSCLFERNGSWHSDSPSPEVLPYTESYNNTHSLSNTSAPMENHSYYLPTTSSRQQQQRISNENDFIYQENDETYHHHHHHQIRNQYHYHQEYQQQY